ncbi:transposase, partial [Nonomuraea sp. NPDC055795]
MTGRSCGSRGFPTTAAGYRALLDWARGFGILLRAGVEGTNSYGTALTRHLHAAGIRVLEVNQPDKAERRRRGKTDETEARSWYATMHAAGVEGLVIKSTDSRYDPSARGWQMGRWGWRGGGGGVWGWWGGPQGCRS